MLASLTCPSPFEGLLTLMSEVLLFLPEPSLNKQPAPLVFTREQEVQSWEVPSTRRRLQKSSLRTLPFFILVLPVFRTSLPPCSPCVDQTGAGWQEGLTHTWANAQLPLPLLCYLVCIFTPKETDGDRKEGKEGGREMAGEVGERLESRRTSTTDQDREGEGTGNEREKVKFHREAQPCKLSWDCLLYKGLHQSLLRSSPSLYLPPSLSQSHSRLLAGSLLTHSSAS